MSNNLIESFRKKDAALPRATDLGHKPSTERPRLHAAEPPRQDKRTYPEPEAQQQEQPVAIRDKRAIEELERKVKQTDKAQFANHKACLRRMMFTIVAETRGIQHWSPKEDAILDATTAWLIDLYFQEGASHDIVGETTRSVQANATTAEDARAAEGVGPLTPKP